jgi:DNA-binding NtrC family response regulator
MGLKWSILIVDDEFGVRESLRMILKTYYEIYTAAGGEESLNIMKERKIHLITLDLNMPKLSGMKKRPFFMGRELSFPSLLTPAKSPRLSMEYSGSELSERVGIQEKNR